MKKDYDDLTPAEKARLTRLLNKLDEKKWAASAIQYNIYREKSDANYLLVSPQIDAVREEYGTKINALFEQISQLREEQGEKVRALNDAHREVARPEFEEYQKASDLAHKWYLSARDEAVAKFYEEVNN